ncbi:MAG TPA: outer-membrane lipoprotein carrier protein LolA [bacterium]|nr:outer-membrane lipoprotein carrier protein LolA [bacterium]
MKLKTLKRLAALAACGWAAPLLGADAPAPLSLDQILDKVEAAQAAAQDVQMDLKTRMRDTMSGQTQEVQGVAMLKAPDLVYVHYQKPTEQFLYIDGALAQMYQPAQKMVYRQQAAPGSPDAPVYLGVGRELKHYADLSRVSIDHQSGDEVTLLFLPKSTDAGFDRMRVTIRKKDWWPVRLEVETPALETRCEFSNFKFDQGLDPGLFVFTRPKGVDVVEGAIF